MSERNDDPDYPAPEWKWDHEAQAGYIDFYPEYKGKRSSRILNPSVPVSILLDCDEDGVLVGIEVLV